MEPIGTRIAQQWGVWFLYGNPKVGKTALVYKIHRWFYKKGYENPVIHVPFGMIKEHEIEKIFSALKKCKWEIKVPYYIFLDDIEHLKKLNHKKEVVQLINSINKLSNEHNVLLVVSSNSKDYLKEFEPVIDSSEKKKSIEYLHLERPTYLGEDIKEFGDTILTIED